MPRLLNRVVLLVDRNVIGPPNELPRTMPRGSRGVLVDQNTAQPRTWTIEFTSPPSSEMVLVEADEKCFSVCD
jgi:hypothetical protein